jgi:formylglycine-generating enzyme required for sulfatase activity
MTTLATSLSFQPRHGPTRHDARGVSGCKGRDEWSSEQANFNGIAPFGKAPQGPNLMRPTRVGAYPSNKLGLCDMHGNVRQWTDTALTPPCREIRGGSWEGVGSACQAWFHIGFLPASLLPSVGFGLARVPVQ